MPYLMPMTAGVAPAFSERYPEAAIIFDNLHMMHDVISDILASPEVRASASARRSCAPPRCSATTPAYAIPVEEWKMMGDMMGVHNMGGPAVGFIAALPRAHRPAGHVHGRDGSRADGSTERSASQEGARGPWRGGGAGDTGGDAARCHGPRDAGRYRGWAHGAMQHGMPGEITWA
jgi:hypothetical protein